MGPEALDAIVSHLDAGGLLGYPTETVYGFGAAVDREGVARIRGLKGRDGQKPMLVLLPGYDPDDSHADAGRDRWGLQWTSTARKLARTFWPGALTLVLLDPDRRFPPGVRSDAGGVAVRVSPHPFVRALLERWGRPLLSTSANRAGERPASTAEGVLESVRDRSGVEHLWIVDGGTLGTARPSTLVEVLGSRPRILREGAIPCTRLRDVVPDLIEVSCNV